MADQTFAEAKQPVFPCQRRGFAQKWVGMARLRRPRRVQRRNGIYSKGPLNAGGDAAGAPSKEFLFCAKPNGGETSCLGCGARFFCNPAVASERESHHPPLVTRHESHCEWFVNKIPAGFLTTFMLRLTLRHMRPPRFLSLKKFGILCVFLAVSLANLQAANGDSATNESLLPAPTSGSNEALRAYLQLQEQIHDTQLTIERNRLQAQMVAAQEGAAVSNRLNAIEEALAFQKTNDLIEAEHTNRMLMGVLAIFATVGLFAVLLMVYFQSDR